MGIKLLYITTNIEGFGGVSRILSVKMNYLIEKFGYEIHVFNSSRNGDEFFYSFNEKIKFHHFISKQNKISAIVDYKNTLIKVLKITNPDCIVNCDNGLKGSLLPIFIGQDIPIIYERHCNRDIKGETFLDNLKLRLSNFIIDLSINKYKAFIIPNKYSYNYWKGENRHIIPNPLWFDLPSKVSTLEKKLVIAVGRCAVEKQYDVLIRIWKDVVEKHPEWILKIYGVEQCPENLKNLVKDLNVSNNIEFCKPIKTIEQVYLNASMLLNTSSSEEFGLAIMEAMAYGLPVIAFKNTLGPRTLIEDHESGFLIEKADLKTYTEKVKLLISDINLRQSIGKNARYSLRKFNLDQTMNLWHDLFQSIQ